MSLIYPSYCPNIANYVVFVKSKTVLFEVQDNYQKQTLRNRCYIYGANGQMGLHIPVHYTQKNRQQTKDIRIDNSTPWKSIHWKSLESAYRTSPFFEFYQDALHPLYQKSDQYLLPFLMECINCINQCLDFKFDYSKTTEYHKTFTNDYRPLINVNSKNNITTPPYHQVFESKYGFINNLSILDLLFNLGPETLSYLQQQNMEDLKFE